MQNKPNFQKSQMNVNLYNTTDYERKRDWTLGQNKPNSNPIKPNLQKAKMNVKSLITKDYRKKDDFLVRINKPNFVKGTKWTQTLFHKRIMKMKPPSGPKKQTQFKPNFPEGKNWCKVCIYKGLWRIMWIWAIKKQTQNKPNQSQGIGYELKSPISPKLTKCPIYQRSCPAMRLNIW